MRSVRVFLKKGGRLIYASHLDMNRFMTRALRLSGLPIWYTEGFNPHPYLTFLLPLSLGFRSDCEIMDIRLTDESIGNDEVMTALNAVLPQDLQVTAVHDPVLKAGKIAYAQFVLSFQTENDRLAVQLSQFLLRDSIVTEKKGKKGKISTIDLAPKIQSFSVDTCENETKLTVVLPAGGSDNVNPSLILSAYDGELPYCRITRTMIYDADMKPFV